ncbi:MAG: formyltetrahydrofolate deformylase [Propionibacteriaceae bacterium]|nr:formyltetrahydrofolate deformylase [Propionibacteriaceae bacterium]
MTQTPALHNSILTFTCLDQAGIVHAVSGAIVAAQGNILESQQYYSPETGMFFIRIQLEHGSERAELSDCLAPVARRFQAEARVYEVGRPTRCLILVSTAPHCLNAILSRVTTGTLPLDVPLVLGNHPDLAELAGFYGVPFEHHAVLAETKADVEARIRQLVVEQDIELVVLARYMQILSPELCDFLTGRAINIHHSFLPGFKGANPYRQAHARGVKLIGATAHFVTADLDEGPIIEQSVTRVGHAKSVSQLSEIGRDIESTVLAHAVRLFAEHRILLDGVRTVVFD